jgi:ABC-type bacteriocin/lantibiotic exporter with double-glycine peptidase domain
MKNYIKDYFLLLPNKKKKDFIFLFFLLFINSIFEFISLGALLPVLQSLTSKSFLDVYFIEFFSSFLKIDLDKKSLILVYLLLFLSVFFIKTFLLIFYNNFKWSYITNLKEELSSKLTLKYLNYSFEKIFKKGSANMIRTLDTELEVFSSTVTDAFLNIFNSILLIIVISLLILLMQPTAFLGSISVFILLYVFFNLITKKKIKKYGEVRFKSAKKRIKIIQELFKSIKEIKIFNSINYFFHLYRNELNHLKKSEKKYYSLLQSFKPILEFFAVIFIFTFLIISINVNSNLTESIVQIGILSIGAFRIIPSVASFLTYTSSLRYHLPVIDLIKTELFQLEFEARSSNSNTVNINFNDKIVMQNLCFSFKNNISILENINIEINKGDIIAISGVTGSGKTTLINLISGFLKPDSGKIIIDGNDLTDVKYILNTAYVSQDTVLLEDSIKRNVAFGIEDSKIDLSKVIKSLKEAEIYDFVKDEHLGVDTNLYESGMNLSGGQKQRIAIARAYYYDSELFILDEPTSALDKNTQKQIINNLLSKNKTIIIISHDEDILSLGKKIYKLKNKSINQVKNILYE